MNRHLLLILSSIILSFPSLAQGLGIDTLDIETNEKKVNWSHVAKKVGVKESINFSDNQIEIRFFMKEAISNQGEFIIYSYDGNQFTGLRGEFEIEFTKDWQKVKRVKIKNKEKLKVGDTAGFWASLVSNNIVTLPDELKLKGGMKKLVKTEDGKEYYERLMVSDGGTYDLELKVNDGYRFISYSNPCTSADYYSDIKAWRNFCQLIKILNKR